MTATSSTESAATRPRVEGDREQEILDAALDVLAEAGYDRLTMDAVATRARASKATLYRRWSSKAALVIDALLADKDLPGATTVPDTGTLRGDLMATYCGMGGLTDSRQLAIFASVLTAVNRDEEFAEAFRREFVAPKVAVATTVFERARDRGEVDGSVDLSLLAPALPGIVLHRLYVLGERPGPDLVARVIDQIVLPAASCGGSAGTTGHTTSPGRGHS